MDNFLWKSFKADFKSDHGDIKWKINEWQHQAGKIKSCKNGLHASVRAIDAMRFVNCEILAQVEAKGNKDIENDKQAWSDMRIVRAYRWKKEDSVSLAVFAVELVIDIYEKQYPNDNRPRKAIEAAKAYLANPTEENRRAAAAAEAWAAAAEAWAAAWAAEVWAWAAEAWAAAAAAEAARAAEAATRAAAWAAARAAAWAAEATRAATRAAAARAAEANYETTLDKCEAFIQKRIKTLEEIK